MGTYWSRSKSFEFDDDGERAPGAKVYFFDAGTSTPRTTFQDAALGTPHAHPVVADGNGRWPAVFLQYGSYKETATTSGGTTLWSVDNIPNPEPFDESFEVDEEAQLNTGDVWFSLKNATRTGAVRLNGRTIGSASSSATERANADTADLFAFLWDNLADAQAAVSGGRGATAAADFAANKRIALPDWRGCGPVGFADMGNTAGTTLDAAPVVTGGPTTTGSVLGANTHTLATSEAPAHTHAVSITSGAGGSHTHSFSATTSSENAHSHTGTTSSDGAHTHDAGNPGSLFLLAVASGGPTVRTGGGDNESTAAATNSSGAHTHTFTTSTQAAHTHTVSGTSGAEAAHTHLVSGTSASTGGGTAHNNLARSGLGTWLIKL